MEGFSFYTISKRWPPYRVFPSHMVCQMNLLSELALARLALVLKYVVMHEHVASQVGRVVGLIGAFPAQVLTSCI